MKPKFDPARRLATVKAAQRRSLSIHVPADLNARIEAFRQAQPIRPTITDTVCYLLELGIGTTKSD